MLYLRRSLEGLSLTYESYVYKARSLSLRTGLAYLKSIFCVYDMKQFPGHDTAISQIYGYRNEYKNPYK